MELPAIIDLEASGFGRGSYPIEVGVALVDGTVHSFLIKPPAHWNHWDTEAEKIHGISRDLLQAEGHSPREVAIALNELLRGQTLYSDAWSFDSSWVGRLYDEAEIVQRFRMDTINKLLNEPQMMGWDAMKKQVIADLGMDMHRAANDVTVLQETFKRITAK
ncbi:MAG: hypothetical protein H7A09_00345 [Oceanospirillaceae bacterium]|nr:hypothetical protein [Oceanospirillaceae bacterium]MCP5350437.1 hypothetical protein [Oceanospirillaceae bacterium]